MKWHADEKGNCHAGCEDRRENDGVGGCGVVHKLTGGLNWALPIGARCAALDIRDALGLDAMDADHELLLRRVERIEHHLDRADGGIWQMNDDQYEASENSGMEGVKGVRGPDFPGPIRTAPPASADGGGEQPEIGTREWYAGAPRWDRRGVVDSILRLLEQEAITRTKAVEMLRYAMDVAWQASTRLVPPAPWDDLNWCP